jgi:hypothetical protein
MKSPLPKKPAKSREQRMVEMAQAMVPNATIARLLAVRSKTIREKLSKARSTGTVIPPNAERIAHEQTRRGVHVIPLSEVEIERLARSAKARKTTGSLLLERVIREALSAENFPVLIDAILDDGVQTK